MAKFTVVDNAPDNLGPDEMVIRTPDFLEFIKKTHAKASGKKVTSLHHLRQILTLIGNEYIDGVFNEYTSIPVGRYEGLPFENNEDLSKILLRMFDKHYPQMIDNVIEKELKNRPLKVNKVYFVGSEDRAGVFIKNGLDRE